MADATYSPKTYREQGGDRFVVASGGSLDVEASGEIDIETSGSLKIAGVAITSTAAELNILDTVTADAGEINTLAGVTAGTAAASKALVLGASKEIATITSATITTLTATNAPIITGQEYQLAIAGAKIGATAGWAVKGAADLYESTCPQSQTNSTLIIPVGGLKIGWTVTAFKIAAQIESAGGAVTLDADLRKQTNAAGDPTDASVGAITQVSVTADTASAAAKTGLAEVIAADEWLYILVKATTAATTDIRFLGCTVTVTEG